MHEGKQVSIEKLENGYSVLTDNRTHQAADFQMLGKLLRDFFSDHKRETDGYMTAGEVLARSTGLYKTVNECERDSLGEARIKLERSEKKVGELITVNAQLVTAEAKASNRVETLGKAHDDLAKLADKLERFLREHGINPANGKRLIAKKKPSPRKR